MSNLDIFKIEYTPKYLKGLVSKLEKVIGVKTGEPLRLDLARHFDALVKYQESGDIKDIPSKNSLNYLSGVLKKVIEKELLSSLCKCVSLTYENISLDGFCNYYFNNYENEDIRVTLAGKFNTINPNSVELEKWKKHRTVLFNTSPVKRILKYVIENRIQLQDINEEFAFNKPYRIIEDIIKAIIEGRYLSLYLERISIEDVLKLLKDEGYKKLHKHVWDYVLPYYLEDARNLKINRDEDHPIFALAKVRLQPTRGPSWITLSDEAKEAYQTWRIGLRLETFFSVDSENERIQFWRSQIKHINGVSEIMKRREVEAFHISLGRYDFIEFKNSGAIYVYESNSINIPKKVKSLGELKDKDKVVNSRFKAKDGGGRIPHHSGWQKNVLRLIREAIS